MTTAHQPLLGTEVHIGTTTDARLGPKDRQARMSKVAELSQNAGPCRVAAVGAPHTAALRLLALLVVVSKCALGAGAWVIVLALATAGCKSSPVPPLTQSGLPEVALSAQAKLNTVQEVAGEFFRGRGYVETRSQHLYEMVFDKPTQSKKSARALRVRLRLHKQPDESWRLVGTPLGVDGWRTDLESEIVLMEGVSQIQAFLREIKTRVESAR